MTPEAQQSRTPYESSTPDATRVVHEDDFIDPDDLSDPEYQIVGREQLMALLEHGMTRSALRICPPLGLLCSHSFILVARKTPV